MREAKEIERLVKANQVLPEGADVFEKFYYCVLDSLIVLYRHEKINKSELRLYQQEYKGIYEQMNLWLKILQKHREIEKILGRAELDECETCKRVARLLDGRSDIVE